MGGQKINITMKQKGEKNNMKLTQISKIAENNHDAIVLILSSCVGFRHEDGASLNLKQFIQAADMILEYLRRDEELIK